MSCQAAENVVREVLTGDWKNIVDALEFRSNFIRSIDEHIQWVIFQRSYANIFWKLMKESSRKVVMREHLMETELANETNFCGYRSSSKALSQTLIVGLDWFCSKLCHGILEPEFGLNQVPAFVTARNWVLDGFSPRPWNDGFRWASVGSVFPMVLKSVAQLEPRPDLTEIWDGRFSVIRVSSAPVFSLRHLSPFGMQQLGLIASWKLFSYLYGHEVVSGQGSSSRKYNYINEASSLPILSDPSSSRQNPPCPLILCFLPPSPQKPITCVRSHWQDCAQTRVPRHKHKRFTMHMCTQTCAGTDHIDKRACIHTWKPTETYTCPQTVHLSTSVIKSSIEERKSDRRWTGPATNEAMQREKRPGHSPKKERCGLSDLLGTL